MTAAAPPSAETVGLRMGYTLETTATLNLGLNSETAIAARRPAPPPPTNRTSWFVTSNGNLSRRPANRSCSPGFGKKLARLYSGRLGVVKQPVRNRFGPAQGQDYFPSLSMRRFSRLARASENRFDFGVNGNVSYRKAVDEKA